MRGDGAGGGLVKVERVTRTRTRTVLAVAAAALLLAPARAARPAAVTPYPPDWPHRAPWKLNREFLLPETERILVVVDAPRGAQPKKDALDHLASLAAKYGQRPASWVRLGAPGAPNVRWIVPSPGTPANRCDRGDGRSMGRHQVSSDEAESLRYLSEVPTCPDGELPADTSFVFVRYVGEFGCAYGAASEVTAAPSCGSRALPVILLAQGAIALGRPPGFPQAFFERRALAHEFGHVLGLASNPVHGRWERLVPYAGGAHCVHLECAVAIPTAGALLKGRMLDYCTACLLDIEQAREHWRADKEFAEAPRLPQPDPAAHVARLKAYSFREGGQADRLLGYGKVVMPALLRRMAALPGGRELSPRGYAARLALRIVAVEDGCRWDTLPPEIASAASGVDVSGDVLAWWSEEEARFMGGDDWKVPLLLRGR